LHGFKQGKDIIIVGKDLILVAKYHWRILKKQ